VLQSKVKRGVGAGYKENYPRNPKTQDFQLWEINGDATIGEVVQ